MKRRYQAIFYACFLGWVGGHHWYLGNYLRGFLYFILWWSLYPATAAGVEMLLYVLSSDQSFDKRYPPRKSVDMPIVDHQKHSPLLL